ncbi:hypothetical protein [Marivirga sp.]|uniref:hypothetical protein n=1 Tax=Marivirga sp. TaxID=2018662 RepID=UPI002D7EB651|nr:hypothetical protein [Marivirga sp.]HET8860203.1 hypothetical protein [Marivirga sp.]
MFDFNNQNIRDFFPDFDDEFQLLDKIMLGSGLYGTILTDAYGESDKEEMYSSLKVICGIFDTHPFDKNGIYCYWDYISREILYIGLSKNLVSRFKQHNTLKPKASKGNKSIRISEHFKYHEKIGFSILVQPPINQETPNLFDKDKEVKVIESSLFQSFIEKYERLPIWNEIEGYKMGRNKKLVDRYGDILEMLTLKEKGYLNGNSTIREVASSKEYQMYECDLNLIRARMYQWKESFSKTLMKVVSFNNFLIAQGDIRAIESNFRLKKMLESGYKEKEINAL